MSFTDGWAALNLEQTDRVPRTEYSAETHWDLVSAVTDIKVTAFDNSELQSKARNEFIKRWNYDFVWSVWVLSHIFGEKKTSMGHAEYASEGLDFSTEIYSHFNDVREVLNFDPVEEYGQIDKKAVIEALNAHYDENKENFPDAVNMTGCYVSCVSGLIEMFGWELLLEACGYDPEKFGQVTNRYGDFILQYFEALAECKSPVIMVHDDICWTSGGIFRPEWYRKFVFPNLKRCIAPLIDSGKKVLFTSDGNYTEYIDDVAALGVNGFVLEPTTDMKYIAEKYGKTHVFVGNADTRILLQGSREDIYNEVKRCMDIGKQCNGFFMAVGNHIPSNTPVENALYYNECYEKLGRR
ncbi:MAG TPA: hypothetical protein GXZ29_11655 [Clostridiales bacterium]|jgi:hypothetical protein|nr:hypothetical protein [Clostridiales bacterium]